MECAEGPLFECALTKQGEILDPWPQLTIGKPKGLEIFVHQQTDWLQSARVKVLGLEKE